MRWTICLLLLALAACNGAGEVTTTGGESSTTTIAPSSTTTTTSAPSLGCPQEAEFVSTGQIDRITQPTSDSRTLGLVSRQTSEGCERFGFDFDTAGDAPATTPPSITASFLAGDRVIRISLDIDSTVITDQLIETRLVDRLFVVRSLDGTMFVDLHLREKANARIIVSNSPARLTLELSPGTGEIGPAAAISDHTVLILPPNEATLEGDVDIAGYSRAFEATVRYIATSGNEVVVEGSTAAADWVDTWGEFTTELELPPGEYDLFVGEESPEDGSFDGVTLSLTIR